MMYKHVTHFVSGESVQRVSLIHCSQFLNISKCGQQTEKNWLYRCPKKAEQQIFIMCILSYMQLIHMCTNDKI